MDHLNIIHNNPTKLVDILKMQNTIGMREALIKALEKAEKKINELEEINKNLLKKLEIKK